MLPRDADGRRKIPVPKKPSKIELNIESLYREWAALQRRNPGLRDVHLDLINATAPEGTMAYFVADDVKSVPGRGEFPDKEVSVGPALKIFLPSIKKSFHQSEGLPRVAIPGASYSSRGRDLTKWAMSIVKHEAAHALNQKQEALGRADIPVTKREATPASRLRETTSEWPSTVHEKRFQLLNRAIAGYGNEPTFSNIGLPPELARRALTLPRG